MKALMYLAGPITRPDPMVNTRDALIRAEELMARYPIVLFTPQLSVFQQVVTPKTHTEWLDYDLHIIEHCEALIRLPGESVGADMEVSFADARGIPVFFDIEGEGQTAFNDWLSALGYSFKDDELDACIRGVQLYGDAQYRQLYPEATR